MKSKALLTHITMLLLITMGSLTGCAAVSSVQYVPLPDENAAPDSATVRIYVLQPNNETDDRDIYDGSLPIGRIQADSYLCWERPAGTTVLTCVGQKKEDAVQLPLVTQNGETYYIEKNCVRQSFLGGIYHDALKTLDAISGQKALLDCVAPLLDRAAPQARAADSLRSLSTDDMNSSRLYTTIWLKDGSMLAGFVVNMTDSVVVIDTGPGHLTVNCLKIERMIAEQRSFLETAEERTRHTIKLEQERDKQLGIFAKALPNSALPTDSADLKSFRKVWLTDGSRMDGHLVKVTQDTVIMKTGEVEICLPCGQISKIISPEMVRRQKNKGILTGILTAAPLGGLGWFAGWETTSRRNCDGKLFCFPNGPKIAAGWLGIFTGVTIGSLIGLSVSKADLNEKTALCRPVNAPLSTDTQKSLTFHAPNLTLQPDAGGLAVRAELLNMKF